MVSDLLEKFVGIVEEKQGGAWHGEESIPVRLSEEEMREIITALQALEDLEMIVNQKDVNIFRWPLSKDYAVVLDGELMVKGSSTLPDALRAAVEAIQKGETE